MNIYYVTTNAIKNNDLERLKILLSNAIFNKYPIISDGLTPKIKTRQLFIQ